MLASDGPRGTSGAGNLNSIDLFDNEFLFNNFDNSWMTFLGSNMQFLYFQGCSFAGNLPQLPPNLKEFDCSFTLISGGFTNANFQNLQQIELLQMDGNFYNSTVPNVLGQLPNLLLLFLGDSELSGDLSYMQGMPKILFNWIDDNPQLGGSIPPFVGSLSTLESFSVSSCDITGVIPSELGNLPNLLQMFLFNNKLVGQIPPELGNINTMNLLQIEGNSFTGSMPAEICARTGFLAPLTVLGADCFDTNFEVRFLKFG